MAWAKKNKITDMNIPDEVRKQIEAQVEQAIKRGGQEYAGYYREGLQDGYCLALEENKRLKGLIKEGFVQLNSKWKKPKGQIYLDWVRFATENNL